ncbi:MAG TPA: esterase-like activity of phytase family protein, partial [Armatimonadota bacterium]|nr:esterase-like activity of phytase family protein [Armatimonadota bacterium]
VKPSRIWEMRVGRSRAVITRSIPLPKSYDLEGIAVQPRGGWWVVSEGAGNAGGTGLTRNLLVRVNRDGSIAEEVQLPDELNAHQRSSGYEGVAVTASGAQVYVCIQREWADDPAGRVKIGRYTPATGEWRFFHYPLDAPPAGGWVGLSEITRINDTTFAVIERDNQSGAAARVKRIYRFSTAGLTPAPAGSPLPLLQKTLVRDLLEQDEFRLEKAEGLALLGPGSFFLVNDNDGAGETRTVRFRSRGGR